MKILIVGDIILDINYFCITNRIAPEADIPVYETTNIEYRLGGASNLAINFKNLDVDIELIGIIGSDTSREQIKKILAENKIKNKLFIDSKRKTTTKNRIFYNNEIKCRYDIEDTFDINFDIEKEIIEYIKNSEKIDAIVISDYNKGMITNNLCEKIIEFSNLNNIYTFVDPKIKNYFKYKNCFCFKPNLNEGKQLSKLDDTDKIISWIKTNINCKHLVLTDGKNGLYLNSVDNNFKYNKFVNLIDVTGAGDITLVILVYVFIKTLDIVKASKISTIIGSISVQYIGNYIVDKKLINKYVCDENNVNADILILL